MKYVAGRIGLFCHKQYTSTESTLSAVPWPQIFFVNSLQQHTHHLKHFVYMYAMFQSESAYSALSKHPPEMKSDALSTHVPANTGLRPNVIRKMTTPAKRAYATRKYDRAPIILRRLMTTLGRGHTIGLDYMSTLPQDIFQPEYTFAEVIVCMLMYVSVSTAFSVLFGGHKHLNPVHAVHCSVRTCPGTKTRCKNTSVADSVYHTVCVLCSLAAKHQTCAHWHCYLMQESSFSQNLSKSVNLLKVYDTVL